MATELRQCAIDDTPTMGFVCNVCDNEYQEMSRYGRMPLPDVLCSDCAPNCISCNKPVCENHRRESGECTACSGPTDAEMRQAGML